MEWLGQATINFDHAIKPRSLTQKDGKETDLLQICKKTTPPCRLNPLLFNGHLQTLWTAVEKNGPEVYYRRRIFQSSRKEYEGTFTVDFAVDPFEEVDDSLPSRTLYYTDEQLDELGSDDHIPTAIVLHGLTGGSHEVYLRHTIAPLIGDGGWQVCVVNSRGCAGSEISSGVTYNARATWDIRQVYARESAASNICPNLVTSDRRMASWKVS
jgi:predicted alpha/beta-fold hydrolase